MEVNFPLTVRDILQSPHFKHAKVVADNEGLNRIVEWVHILEITNSGQFVNGNDLILSTGVGWKGKEDAVFFLQQLIERNVSGLCIQLGYLFKEMPEEMIELANNHHFPLIFFTEDKEVRFIDIIHELHTMIINQEYRMFSDLEKFSQRLNSILVSPHNLKDILVFLHRYLGINVVYIPLRGKPLFAPSLSPSKQKKILESIRHMQTNLLTTDNAKTTIFNGTIACKKIEALNQKWADLAFVSNERRLTKLELLILDRCALIIAQDLLRQLYVEEKKRTKEDQWLQEWLDGKYCDREVYQHLKKLDHPVEPSGCVVCLVEFPLSKSQNESLSELMIHMTIVARSLFEQQGFYLLKSSGYNQMTYILLDKRNRQTWKTRINVVIKQLKQLTQGRDKEFHNITFGIGKMIERLSDLNKSFKTAQEAIYIQKRIGKTDNPFYSDLHIYRLISQISSSNLNEFIMDYLQPVIEYDRQHEGELLQTLKVLLKCNGCKQETAKRLFIVRQTLYHRIQKLEDLLGQDFMSPEKRMAIEFAIYAYHYLNP